MSKEEFKDIHLSDERQPKAPHLYGKSWNQYKETAVNNEQLYDEFDGPHPNHQRNRSVIGNEPHNNIYIIIRKKRSALPLKVDW